MSARKKGSNISTTNYNFRPMNDFQTRAEAKGTKPLPSPISVSGALLNMLMFACRKIIFVNTNIKVAIYAAVLFLSFVGDITPFPRSYFSQSSNPLNQYFVKLGWAWTLLGTVPFVLLTSFTYCCGNRRMVGWHLSRLCVATAAWFIFTKSFSYLENNTGRCSVKTEKFSSKPACLAAGHFWYSLDISGHAFILVYSSLIMIEEARAIVGWDTIQDLIRNEEHQRSINETDLSSPLKHLSQEEMRLLKLCFKSFTPYVRLILFGMTLLICLWDVMILATALYFHTMVEKFISGLLAIVVWFVTYRYWYSKTKFLPYAPGHGTFFYNKTKVANDISSRTFGTAKTKFDQGPSFMGMPLYSPRSGMAEEENSTSKTIASPLKSGPNVYSTKTGPASRT